MSPAAVQTREMPESLQRPSFVGGSVYFIQAGANGPIKIGKAINVARRLMILQTGSFEVLSVLAAAPGEDAHERALHRKFSAFRMIGEWFQPSRPVLECVDSVKTTGVLPLLVLADSMTGSAVPALQAAIEVLGSQFAAARAIGITPQAVSEIARKGRRVPAEWCIPLEKATGGKVTREALRPDLFLGYCAVHS